MTQQYTCIKCGIENPRTVYDTSALSVCCNESYCDECLMLHMFKSHSDTPVQHNPDIAARIKAWTD